MTRRKKIGLKRSQFKRRKDRLEIELAKSATQELYFYKKILKSILHNDYRLSHAPVVA